MPRKQKTAAEVIGTAGIASWHWYSIDQYKAATFFSQRCADLEAAPKRPLVIDDVEVSPFDEAQQIEHSACATATILSSISFLEASLNELFASAAHDNLEVGGGRGPLTERERRALCDVADMLERNNFLDKFQLVLHLLNRQPFNLGAQPYQDTDLLVKLRNLLVHAKPAWVAYTSSGLDSEEKVLKGLASKKFPRHPFADEGSEFFPDKCLGAACADWAWRTARTFADDFFSRLGITPAYAETEGRRRKRRQPTEAAD